MVSTRNPRSQRPWAEACSRDLLGDRWPRSASDLWCQRRDGGESRRLGETEAPAVPILHFSASCFFLHPRKPEPLLGSYSGPGMLCQHLPRAQDRARGLVLGQPTWRRIENVPSDIHSNPPNTTHRTPRGKCRKASERGRPSPLLSLSVPFPGQVPEKRAILRGAPVATVPMPAPP